MAAHSVVRALYANYTGPLYRVLRDSDKAALDIGVLHSGFARAAEQEAFCAGSSCYILRLYDQSPRGNHLDTAPAGGACHHPLSPVNASRERIWVGGHTHGVYSAYFEGNMGYRNDRTSGVATGEMEQTIYMVTSGDHVNGGCDYGNAETDNNDDGKGTMEALYFGTSSGWGHGQGKGPWVMAECGQAARRLVTCRCCCSVRAASTHTCAWLRLSPRCAVNCLPTCGFDSAPALRTGSGRARRGPRRLPRSAIRS